MYFMKNKIKKMENKVKVKLTAKEYEFLNSYATHHNKQRAMKESGLALKGTGVEYTPKVINEKADMILRNPEARKYIHEYHETIFQNHCHDIERSIEEAYSNYILLRDSGKYIAMNQAFDTYLKLCRFLTPDKGLSVNTQIVAGEGQSINISYIKPEDKKE